MLELIQTAGVLATMLVVGKIYRLLADEKKDREANQDTEQGDSND